MSVTTLGKEWILAQELRIIISDVLETVRTGLLLLDGQLVPVSLHAVTELHPQVGLLLGGKTLPALLDASESRVSDGMVGGSANFQGVQRGNWAGAEGGLSARHSASDGAKKHCAAGGRWQATSIMSQWMMEVIWRGQASLEPRRTRREKRVEGGREMGKED